MTTHHPKFCKHTALQLVDLTTEKLLATALITYDVQFHLNYCTFRNYYTDLMQHCTCMRVIGHHSPMLQIDRVCLVMGSNSGLHWISKENLK